MNKKELKVAADTPVGLLAGSISKNLDEGYFVEVIAIGASAVNQAVKSVATSSGHAGAKGKELKVQIGFTDVKVDNVAEKRTAMCFRISYVN
jgi:stage V sporulation protein S